MNKKVFHTLEYNKIIDLLAAHASSARAKEMCLNLSPSCDMDAITHALQETNDALSRIYKKYYGVFTADLTLRSRQTCKGIWTE